MDIYLLICFHRVMIVNTKFTGKHKRKFPSIQINKQTLIIIILMSILCKIVSSTFLFNSKYMFICLFVCFIL